jgi:nitrite reductase (NO-forming)
MRFLSFLAVSALMACGGEAPKPAEPAPVAAPAPAPEPPKVEEKKDLAAMSPDEQKAYLLDLGKKVYESGGNGGIACTTCHGAEGKGVEGAFPPLAGSGDYMGDCAKHAGFVLKGLNGESEVQGKKYNGALPAQANLSDEEIAAVITFERNSWGNTSSVCLPADVAAARAAL